MVNHVLERLKFRDLYTEEEGCVQRPNNGIILQSTMVNDRFNKKGFSHERKLKKIHLPVYWG